MPKRQEKDIHKIAMKRFNSVMLREREQRRQAVEDRVFVNARDGQWSQADINLRHNRPRYTVDRISPAIRQVMGDQKQNRTVIKVMPRNQAASTKTAKLLNGLIRDIESNSSATNIYDDAAGESLEGGYGGWRILTQLSEDNPFEQEIIIEWLPSAETSLFFGPSNHYDKHDAPWAFVVEQMTREQFKEDYPDVIPTDFQSIDYFKQYNCSDWFRDDMVQVAEYWVKEPAKKRIGLLSDGAVIELPLDEVEAAGMLEELSASGIMLVEEKIIDSHNVVMYKMTGSDIIEGPNLFPSKFIPLVPVFGITATVTDTRYVRGIVQKAVDAQRIFNFTLSSNIEAVAQTPKDPTYYTPAQVEGFEVLYENQNVENRSHLPYNHDPKEPGPPKRGGAPQVQEALMRQAQQAALDIHATTGIEPASLGNSPELRSGKAVQAQQAMGDRGSFVYQDNKNKSIAYTGEILVDMIPRIYDTPRMIRVIGDDEVAELVEINQMVVNPATGEETLVHDLSGGRYSVKVVTGPQFATQRAESASQLIDLAAADPELRAITRDLIVKNLAVVESEELFSRVHKIQVEQGIVEPTEEEVAEGLGQAAPPTPEQIALLDNVNLQNEKLKADILKADADTNKKTIETQTETIESLKTLLEAYKLQIDMGIPLSRQEHNIRIKTNDVIGEVQQEVDPGPNSEQAEDIAQNLISSGLSPRQEVPLPIAPAGAPGIVSEAELI